MGTAPTASFSPWTLFPDVDTPRPLSFLPWGALRVDATPGDPLLQLPQEMSRVYALWEPPPMSPTPRSTEEPGLQWDLSTLPQL